MARLLLGHRGRQLYPPPRNNPDLMSRRGVAPLPSSQASWFSRQTLMVLIVGVMFGYVALPMLMIQNSGFDDLKMTRIVHVPVANTADPVPVPAVRGSTDARSRTLLPNSGADSGNQKDEDENKNTAKRSATIKDAQSRLVADQKVMSQQSLPTSTTSNVFQTLVLPDAQRKKILVTGGAGFVGSHLVDKLMVEGHEVTVVDNFFTGQRKNVAHWLHHPNFKYVQGERAACCLLLAYL